MIAGCTYAHNYPPRFEHKTYGIEGAVSVYISTGPISIIQSTFIDNVALEKDGGAIKIETTDSRIVIDSCTFIENKSSGPLNFGGAAVYIEKASSILINRTNFTNNQGSRDGVAALYMTVNNAAVVAINESYFYGNLNTMIYGEGDYGYAQTVHSGGHTQFTDY